MRLMDGSPHDFIAQHKDSDLKHLSEFKHRTFNTTDLLYCIAFLKHHYQLYKSLENAFTQNNPADVKHMLVQFHQYFFSLEFAPKRTQKHIATPVRNSTCKRLNMYLRWIPMASLEAVTDGVPNRHTCGRLAIRCSSASGWPQIARLTISAGSSIM